AKIAIVNKVFGIKGKKHQLKKVLNDERNILTISEWLSAIRDADYIVTDSFHGMVFSIIFRKNFIAIGNARRGMTRFSSLAALLGLESRIVTDIMQVGEQVGADIDYREISQKISYLRSGSVEFLTKSLE